MKSITLGIFQLFAAVGIISSFNDFSVAEGNAWSGRWGDLNQGGVTYELMDCMAGHQGLLVMWGSTL